MLIVREVMNCYPGKTRPMVEKMLTMSKLMEKHGMGKMRVMTDVIAEGYWTVVMEFEVASLSAFENMMSAQAMPKEAEKEMEEVMKGYHDLVRAGRREVYKIEG